MDVFFVLTNAITVACIYGLIAIAVSITWSSLGLINLAYGFIFTFAGYGAWLFAKHVSEQPVVIAAAGILMGAVAGILVCVVVFIPLHDKPNFTTRGMIATLAISLIGSQSFLMFFGPRPKSLPELFGFWTLDLFGVTLTSDKIGIVVCSTLMLFAVVRWMRGSRRGLEIRAMMMNPHAASIVGIGVRSTAAFLTSWLSITYGLPWYLLPLIGSAIGLVFGLAIALPALRLDGFYYALLTLGLNELCRVFFTTSKEFGSASGGLYGADSFIQESWDPMVQSYVGYYTAFALLLGALSLFRLINGKRLGRVLRMAPEKREAFAAACGVDYKRARIVIFLATSVALGFIGGFYTAQYRGVAFSIFSFDTVLLGLAMLAIGGIGKAEGAVLGTLVVVFLDKVLLDWGPIRHFLIGALMLASVLFLNNGYFGIKKQFNAWRDKKRGEWRSTRTEKGGEALPEEATESNDKDQLYFRRFDKIQRDYLKKLITPEIIEEHRRQPLGQHSEALERVRPDPASWRKRSRIPPTGCGR